MEQSGQVSNPWISKGTKHLFSDSHCSSTYADPVVTNSHETGVQKDYFIHSTAKNEQSVDESQLTKLHLFMESLRSHMDQITEENGAAVDSSVLEGFATIGFENEGNYCYQNSIIQVIVLLHFYIVSSSYPIFLLSS